MELAVITGKTSQKGIKIDKPVSGLLIVCDGKALKDLTIEELTASVDSKTGQNEPILPRINMAQAIEMAATGEGVAISNETTGSESFEASIEFSAGTAYDLQNDETILVDLEGLNAAKTYTIYGVEIPVLERAYSKYEKKILVAGEDTKNLDVSEFSQICIDNLDKLTEVEITYLNGYNAKYKNAELRMLMARMNDLVSIGKNATDTIATAVHSNMLTLPLAIASRITIISDASVKHTIVLRKEMIEG